jgi:hypothetical protein
LQECGIENLSVGNHENPGGGWEDESYNTTGTGAYEVHNSYAIRFIYSENCWIKNVSSFRAAANTGDYHLLSNGMIIDQSRFITVDSCSFRNPQYEGGGGNGYMFTLESNDCLISNSMANHGRHNFDFKYPYSNGNVIHRCRSENSRYASDFHMFLSMSNLFDACVLNGDYLEAVYRPYGEASLHGYTTSQSVFYNTSGEAYHSGKDFLIDSRQYGRGYIIGTSGAACEVNLDPVEGSAEGYLYITSPRDFNEGIGKGEYLVPASLYLDQLDRRKKNTHSAIPRFEVEVRIRDAETKALLNDCRVVLNYDTLMTNTEGAASFRNVLEFFTLSVIRDYYVPLRDKQLMIYGDTTLTLYLERRNYQVTVQLKRTSTLEPLGLTTVIFNSESRVTNSSGEAYFTVNGGSNSYTIDKTYYRPETGNVTVQTDTVLIFYLLQIHANLRIRLRDGTAPVNNAMVIAHEDTLISNALGDALFNRLPVPASYPYLIRKTGYEAVEGSAYFTRDTTLNIAMVVQSTGTGPQMTENTVQCWPNPVTDQLHITLPGNHALKSIHITDLKGIELDQLKTDDLTVSINVSGYPPGIYLLQVFTGTFQFTRYFFKK